MLNPEWYEQKTIRGDFLRAVRQYQMDPAQRLDLEPLLGKPSAAGAARGGVAAVSDPAVRERVLSRGGLAGRRPVEWRGTPGMRITALEVDGFGVWSGLKLGEMAGGLNVFFGPNEAGKTTLMQFIRSVLYGFAPPRRRYLPPLRGGRPGGSLAVQASHGQFLVSRFDNPADPQAEILSLVGADGSRHGEQLLESLLSGVDEAIFNNVFAVGLRELQELGTLSDTDAAALLYSLSIGLDRVSLVEVMHELNGLAGPHPRPRRRPLPDRTALAERDKLRAEIVELGTLNRRYARLAAERGAARPRGRPPARGTAAVGPAVAADRHRAGPASAVANAGSCWTSNWRPSVRRSRCRKAPSSGWPD